MGFPFNCRKIEPDPVHRERLPFFVSTREKKANGTGYADLEVTPEVASMDSSFWGHDFVNRGAIIWTRNELVPVRVMLNEMDSDVQIAPFNYFAYRDAALG
jgi:hypothetical protein